MNNTANDVYAAMLAEYRPRTIRDEKMYKASLVRFESLMRDFDKNPSADLGSVMDLCAMTITRYEDDNHPALPNGSPREIVAHLLQERGGNATALASDLEITRGQMSNILSGKRAITIDVARALGECFSLPPSLFLEIG